MNNYQAKETGFFNVPVESTIILCPECKKLELKSTVRLIEMNYAKLNDIFWDQQGRRHVHHTGVHEARFVCDKQHHFSVTDNPRCFCGS